MNKKLKNTIETTNPYRSMSFNKINAPLKVTDEPKCRVIKSSSDLRSKGGKR
jgi:hypothetical protein